MRKNLDQSKQEYRQLKRTLDDDLQAKIEALELDREEIVDKIKTLEYAIDAMSTTDNHKIRNSRMSGNAYNRDNSLSQALSDYDDCWNIHTFKEALKMFGVKLKQWE